MDVNNDKNEYSFQRNQNLITAFKFELKMSLEDLKNFLCESMQCDWTIRDKEYYGDYLVGMKKDTKTIMRIFETNDNYLLVDIINRTPVAMNIWNDEIKELQTALEKVGVMQFIPADNYY